jgi:MtaA/CmuA family methyltransferase
MIDTQPQHPGQSRLTSKQLVAQTIAGRATPRPVAGPLAVHYCAAVAGVSLRQYTSAARVLADCVIQYYERFRPDAVWLSADTWVTAQAMGAAVDFPGDNQPLAGTGQPLIRQPSDVDRIPPPDPSSQGRWPLMLEALQRVVDAIGKEVFVVACLDQYPFSLGCALLGMDRLMLSLVDDRPLVDAVLHRGVEFAVAYGRALAAAGADMLSGGDSPAGLIGPARYRGVALPFEQQVVQQLQQTTGLPVSLHICGDATPILQDMAASGADVLELDHQVDMPRACRVLGPDVTIWGNLDPVGLLSLQSPGQVASATANLIESFHAAGHRRFVVSSGCTLAMETPAENLHALIAATR